MKILPCVLLLSLVGCASTSTTRTVIDRAGQVTSSPEWVTNEIVHFEKDGKLYFRGSANFMADGTNKEACLRSSEQLALFSPLSAIVDEFFQNEGVAIDNKTANSTYQMVLSTGRKNAPRIPSNQVIKRFWDITEQRDGNTKELTRELTCYSLAEVDKNDYERAKKELIEGLQKEPEIKKLLKEVQAKQREKLLSSEKKD